MSQSQGQNLVTLLQLWQEKLGYLQKELVKTSHPLIKFELNSQIQETEQEIQKLERMKASSVSPAEINDVSRYSLNKSSYFRSHLDLLEKVIDCQTLLSSLAEKRMQVQDWKELHEKFQDLSIKLIIIRGLISSDDYETIIHDLEIHWSFECGPKIMRYMQFGRIIRNGHVRDKFEEVDRHSDWSNKIMNLVQKINEIINQSLEPENLKTRMKFLREYLSSLERINGSILAFLDDNLKVKISELENDFEKLRSRLLPSFSQLVS